MRTVKEHNPYGKDKRCDIRKSSRSLTRAIKCSSSDTTCLKRSLALSASTSSNKSEYLEWLSLLTFTCTQTNIHPCMHMPSHIHRCATSPQVVQWIHPNMAGHVTMETAGLCGMTSRDAAFWFDSNCFVIQQECHSFTLYRCRYSYRYRYITFRYCVLHKVNSRKKL